MIMSEIGNKIKEVFGGAAVYKILPIMMCSMAGIYLLLSRII